MTVFEKLVLEKLDDMKSEMNDMKSEMNDMKSDIKALKKTAALTENVLVPKVQLLYECYSSLEKKVNISEDVQEEVKTLRYEVDLIKAVHQMN